MNVKIGTIMMAAVLVATGAQADSFGVGANAFTLDFVNIGNAGNLADTSGYGAVADSYRMGMHEVTIDQFAKARAADIRIGDGDENPWSIGVNGAASRTSWYEGAKFANWLTTGNATTGAYQFNAGGTTLLAVDRAAAIATYGTVYVLPTEDEWYKAAYLKSDGSAYTLYATGDSAPGGENYNNVNSAPWDVGSGSVSSIENNGTFDMNGNVWEWNESTGDGTLTTLGESRVFRGGAFNTLEITLRSSIRNDIVPPFESDNIGFRVVAIPEPSSIALMGVAGGFALFMRRRFRR